MGITALTFFSSEPKKVRKRLEGSRRLFSEKDSSVLYPLNIVPPQTIQVRCNFLMAVF